jgi:hypothetical protein
MSKLPNDCIWLFYFQVGWGGGGVVWGWLYLINSLQEKKPKNTDSHPAVLLNSFKFCAPVVFVWFWLFFSCLRRRGRRYKRGSDITIFVPIIAFYFFTTMQGSYTFWLNKIKDFQGQKLQFSSTFFWAFSYVKPCLTLTFFKWKCLYPVIQQ